MEHEVAVSHEPPKIVEREISKKTGVPAGLIEVKLAWCYVRKGEAVLQFILVNARELAEKGYDVSEYYRFIVKEGETLTTYA
jgi:hypothetical protein